MAAARPVGSRGWRPRIGAAAHLIRVARVELDDAVPPHPTLRWLQSGCAAARTPAASAASAAGAAATLGGAGVDLHLLRPLQAGSKERRTVSDFLEVAVSARLDLHALHHLLVHLLLALGDLRPGGQRNTISRWHCRRQSRLKLSAAHLLLVVPPVHLVERGHRRLARGSTPHHDRLWLGPARHGDAV